MKYFPRILLLLAMACIPAAADATHNRAGEITYKQIGLYTFEATVTTYTHTMSTQADRDDIPLEWGDGLSDILPRVSKTVQGPPSANIQVNVYKGTHTYSGPGRYMLQFRDPNRVQDIRNMQQSVIVPFYIETELQLFPFQGYNRSPLLLQPPIDFACIQKVFVHNPNAFDPDGDSLVFSLIPPKQAEGMDVPGYFKPGSSNFFRLDSVTGELVWDSPESKGIYNIAILIEEYRNGRRIGYVVRDMQILVESCNNNPPVIKEIKDTCIVAGSGFEIETEVSATDIDPGDKIELTATGGPFIVPVKPAVFTPTTAVGINMVKATFRWEPDCRHIRKQPYRVVFRAVDDDPTVPLTNLEHFDIKIIGPPPRDIAASAFGNNITITWQKPLCEPVGYIIYRKVDSSSWAPGYCETGIPGSTGFVKIDSVMDANILTYTDDNGGSGLSPGIKYCYRTTALYINEGNYEIAEGIASEEVCEELRKDVPVITHVSIERTDNTNGKIYVAWSSPTELDTMQNPGPYSYVVSRALRTMPESWNVADSFRSATLGNFNDTTLIDSGLNTSANAYIYKIEFYNTIAGTPVYIGKPVDATSVFLSARRAHEKIELSWTYNVPWFNTRYVVYKKNDLSGSWDSLTTTLTQNYTDTGLINGTSYCYKVKTIGSYHTSGFTDPILNFSQELCASPRDTIVPCALNLEGAANCDARISTLTWTHPG
ncbi:MAG: fibronectin type III domain-containing protein, partial [Bacteroidota bacterium]|nr:fibronectin type III domain-containing protein [Bacteroidota bacterium]